jgi:hypothetical protein
MTKLQQTRLYFPAWAAAFRAHWRRDRGVVLPASDDAPPVAVREFVEQLEEIATRRARKEVRAFTADDLRHASHILALGRTCSSNDLSNADLDRVMALWRMLADPDDLQARMTWDNPATADRTRMLWFVRNCGLPAPYVLSVMQSRFQTADAASLETPRLRQLVMTLRERVRARGAKKAAAAAEAKG